ncbi:uncharacterized protein LOC133192949 [Saccostrea echinata]|uniref:uncharacterized protein LOC133192949 n=1 Tax=Saccostrea echinata TaxID=191078 RepID=UPI002A812BC0|nr:uncharacterized protein LOC133192949 [Saccostrea echinata]
MTDKIGLLYVRNKNTVQCLVEDITSKLGKQHVVDAGIEEAFILNKKLTSIGMRFGESLKRCKSLIVITDNAYWDSLWNEGSKKIHNKLDGIAKRFHHRECFNVLLEDEEDDIVRFQIESILFVGCNISQELQQEFFPKPIRNEPYFISDEHLTEYPPRKTHKHKASQMILSLNENAPDTFERLAGQIFDEIAKHGFPNTNFTQDFLTYPPPATNNLKQSMSTRKLYYPRNIIPRNNVRCTYIISSTDKDDGAEEGNYYPFESPGLCLYIGVLEFDQENSEISLENRHSACMEYEKIKRTFERLGCIFEKKTNPTDQEALEFLKEGIERCNKMKPSYFVLVISTHGQEVPMVIKEDKQTEEHPFGNVQKEYSQTEMVHQLFFYNGKSLLTRDIIKMFDHQSCPTLKSKPCFFFIQACRSRFGLDGHKNFDPGVFVNVFTPVGEIVDIQELEGPDCNDASGEPRQLDKSDAKRSKMNQTEEEQKTRLKQIHEWKIAVLHRHILDYRTYLSNDLTVSAQEAQKTDETATKLNETLRAEGFTEDQVKELGNKCQGFEQEILDFFFPEPIISDPPPCVNDALVMFASAPGKEAYNRDKQGGWLITNLVAQLNETLDTESEKIDLLAELTKVSGRIAYRYETDTDTVESSGHKSVPCLYHKLSRDVIIWPNKIKNARELCDLEM